MFVFSYLFSLLNASMGAVMNLGSLLLLNYHALEVFFCLLSFTLMLCILFSDPSHNKVSLLNSVVTFSELQSVAQLSPIFGC